MEGERKVMMSSDYLRESRHSNLCSHSVVPRIDCLQFGLSDYGDGEDQTLTRVLDPQGPSSRPGSSPPTL